MSKITNSLIIPAYEEKTEYTDMITYGFETPDGQVQISPGKAIYFRLPSNIENLEWSDISVTLILKMWNETDNVPLNTLDSFVETLWAESLGLEQVNLYGLTPQTYSLSQQLYDSYLESSSLWFGLTDQKYELPVAQSTPENLQSSTMNFIGWTTSNAADTILDISKTDKASHQIFYGNTSGQTKGPSLYILNNQQAAAAQACGYSIGVGGIREYLDYQGQITFRVRKYSTGFSLLQPPPASTKPYGLPLKEATLTAPIGFSTTSVQTVSTLDSTLRLPEGSWEEETSATFLNGSIGTFSPKYIMFHAPDIPPSLGKDVSFRLLCIHLAYFDKDPTNLDER